MSGSSSGGGAGGPHTILRSPSGRTVRELDIDAKVAQEIADLIESKSPDFAKALRDTCMDADAGTP